MERINIFFLHGFLGRPEDWNDVLANLPLNKNVNLFALDYFNDPELNPRHSFEEFAENFIRRVKNQTHISDSNILVGYSLGGRLSLHVFEKAPEIWQKIICISTNLGFEDSFSGLSLDSDERRTRWLNDSKWSEEFKKNSWSAIMAKWNAQAVFTGGKDEPLRLEENYSRELLSLALTQWSLAQQKNMRSLLREYKSKFLSLAGEKDEKFLNLSAKLKTENPEFDLKIITNASHRILFDNPLAVSDLIDQVIKSY